MTKGREISLGVLPSDMTEYISLLCAENQIVSYCYLLHWKKCLVRNRIWPISSSTSVNSTENVTKLVLEMWLLLV